MGIEYNKDVEEYNKILEDEVHALDKNLKDAKKELEILNALMPAIKWAKNKTRIGRSALEDLRQDLSEDNSDASVACAADQMVDLCEYEMIATLGKNEALREACRRKYPNQFVKHLFNVELEWEDDEDLMEPE